MGGRLCYRPQPNLARESSQKNHFSRIGGVLACFAGNQRDDVGQESAMEAIRIESVVKKFGSVCALDGVDVQIGAGELFFLLGGSGSGKTTLLRCIAGLEKLDRGRIWFGEQDMAGVAPHKRGAAMVFQSYALWPHLTVAQNIAFGLEERHVSKDEIRRRVDEALEMVRLPGFGGRSIDEMSGGQQQRVSLARALVVRPKCLLLDEPLSNLDARLRIEMRAEIRLILKQHGLTGIYVTHDQEEALVMADRMAVMDAGKIIQVGTPEAIYRTPHDVKVACFMGETNLIRGTICDRQGQLAWVRTETGVMAGHLSQPSWDPRVGDAAMLSIRPEAWRIGLTGNTNHLTGSITDVSYLGRLIQYRIATAAGSQQVIELNPHPLRVVSSALLDLHAMPEDVVVLQDHATHALPSPSLRHSSNS